MNLIKKERKEQREKELHNIYFFDLCVHAHAFITRFSNQLTPPHPRLKKNMDPRLIYVFKMKMELVLTLFFTYPPDIR